MPPAIPSFLTVGARFRRASEREEVTFLGFTADNRVQLNGREGLLRVPRREDGHLDCPDWTTFRTLVAAGQLRPISPPLASAVRNRARRRQLASRKQAKKLDPRAPFRMDVLRAYDQERPALGDAALEAWRDERWDKDAVRAEYGCWPSGSTLRKWITGRGRAGQRLWADTTDERASRRGHRRHRSAVAVAAWHAVWCARQPARNMVSCYSLYCVDHRRLLLGEPLSFEPAEPLPRPPGDPEPYCYEAFRRMVHAAGTKGVTEAKGGKRLVRRKYGGGGASPEVSVLFEAVQLDPQAFPAFILVDEERGAVAGIASTTLTIDRLTKVVPGWDVDPGAPSTSTIMRTMLHCSVPKEIPARFRDRFPQLADIGGRISAYELDHGLENEGRQVEDSIGDAFGEVRWATPDAPMDKQDVERLQRTIQGYIASELESHTLDPRTVRELGLDPRGKAVLTIAAFRILLAEAIATYHLQPHDGLPGRVCPLEAFVIAARRDGLDWPADLDELEAATGDVLYDVRFERTGFKIEGLRYSEFALTPEILAEELAVEARRGKTSKGWIKRKVRFRPDDLGHAWVWSEHRQTYVKLPCTRPDYSTGLPMWLHLRLRSFASASGLPFITQEEQLEARAGFVELVRSISATASETARRLQFKLLGQPAMRAAFGDAIDLLRAPATPTGEFSAIIHDVGPGERLDGHRPQPRPHRRGGGGVEPVDDDGLPASPPAASEPAPACPPGDDTASTADGRLSAPRIERVPSSAGGRGGRPAAPRAGRAKSRPDAPDDRPATGRASPSSTSSWGDYE